MLPKTFIFCTAVILVSCSSLKLNYRFADRMLLYKLGDYVELTGVQEDQVSTEIDNFIRWHSRVELPRYIKILQNVKVDIQNGTLPAKWSLYQADYQVHQKKLLQKIIPPLSKVLLDLDTKQLQKLRRRLLSGNNKLRLLQKLGTKIRKNKRLNWYLENYTYWLGQLTEKQIIKITNFTSGLPLTLEAQLEYRLRAEYSFFQLIKQPETKAEEIEKLLENLRSQKERQQKQKNNLTAIFLSKFGKMVTGEQKEYLTARIDDIIADFQDIIRTHSVVALTE